MKDKKMNSNKGEEYLGVSEFASTLNGDNPQEMLRVLKLFGRIVRRERRIALSIRTNGGGDNNRSKLGEDEEETVSADGFGDDR